MCRMYIAYNSLFVAMIRYLFIVHHDTAKLWDFEKVAKLFRIYSLVIPITIAFIGIFVDPHAIYQNKLEFKECISSYQGLNTTYNITIPDIYPRRWTLQYVPETVVFTIDIVFTFITMIVGLNVLEGFLYYQIFKSIKR